MRRGHLGFAVRELTRRLAVLQEAYADAATDPVALKQAVDQLDADRQRLLDELDRLDESPVATFGAGGWGVDIRAIFETFDKRYQRFRRDLDRSEEP